MVITLSRKNNEKPKVQNFLNGNTIGFKVDRIVSIVDRQEDGEADRNMTAAHVDLYSLFSLDELCE